MALLKGYLFIILSAMCSGVLPIFVKLGYQSGISLETMLALRFLIATVILVCYGFATGKLKFIFIKHKITNLGIQGMLYFGFSFCLMASARYLPAGIVSILFYLFPTIVITIMTLFFREKMSLKKFIAVALTLIGCLLVIEIFNQHITINWWGITLGLGAALCFAIYNITGSSLTKEFEPMVVITCVMVVCSLCVLITTPPVSLLKGELTTTHWLIGIGMAVISSILSAQCYLKGLSVLGASQASIVSTIEPILTLTIAWLFLGERITMIQLLGGICILSGIITLQTNKSKGNSVIKENILF